MTQSLGYGVMGTNYNLNWASLRLIFNVLLLLFCHSTRKLPAMLSKNLFSLTFLKWLIHMYAVCKTLVGHLKVFISAIDSS